MKVYLIQCIHTTNITWQQLRRSNCGILESSSLHLRAGPA